MLYLTDRLVVMVEHNIGESGANGVNPWETLVDQSNEIFLTAQLAGSFSFENERECGGLPKHWIIAFITLSTIMETRLTEQLVARGDSMGASIKYVRIEGGWGVTPKAYRCIQGGGGSRK